VVLSWLRMLLRILNEKNNFFRVSRTNGEEKVIKDSE
jgi:hypothetical protein